MIYTCVPLNFVLFSYIKIDLDRKHLLISIDNKIDGSSNHFLLLVYDINMI